MLSDKAIKSHQERFDINSLTIAPYHPDNVQPCSYDLNLGPRCCIISDSVLNSKISAKMFEIYDGLVLQPGNLYLCETVQRVRLPRSIAGLVTGRSSLGRLGVSVHQTAGLIDPGFDGVITLELSTLNTVKLEYNTAIAQIMFHVLSEPCEASYNGRYQGALTVQRSKLND